MTEVQLDPETLRAIIARELTGARQRTTLLTDSVDEADLVRQHSPLMSPLVWDLAHIANQEELWLLREVGGREPMHPEIDPLYDAFEHPRSERPTLPLLPPGEARAYGHEVRGRVLDLLEHATFTGPRLLGNGFAFGMIAQHEVQHDETMLITHQIRAGAPVIAHGFKEQFVIFAFEIRLFSRVSFDGLVNVLAIIQADNPFLQFFEGVCCNLTQDCVGARFLKHGKTIVRQPDLVPNIIQGTNGVLKIDFTRFESGDAIQRGVCRGNRLTDGDTDFIRVQLKLREAHDRIELRGAAFEFMKPIRV